MAGFLYAIVVTCGQVQVRHDESLVAQMMTQRRELYNNKTIVFIDIDQHSHLLRRAHQKSDVGLKSSTE